ncbi:hypothetical protein FB471_4544 [Amycolatopsis cihanbeyliensis]|uniref:Uncharacterized protein n=1 Tax=Amycolatopsis cihanbeyliensis TaxID=1128664 RepID=A0A542DNR4_AMYCI|nr:hypothetical protein FB471_4544 [Amycolatopsis cihanbeyliensis]
MLLTVLLAAVVTAGALVTAVLLRPRATPPAAEEPVRGPSTAARECGDGACRELASARVHGTEVALLAGENGRSARVRVGGPGSDTVLETRITSMGARLDGDSLDCVAAATSVCLVRGSVDGAEIGEVLVSRGDGWRQAERPYFSDAGLIVLDDVTGSGEPEVVVVQHICAQSGSAACRVRPVRAEVFGLGGEQYGCTGSYTAPGHIRGWPDVQVSPRQLRPCR